MANGLPTSGSLNHRRRVIPLGPHTADEGPVTSTDPLARDAVQELLSELVRIPSVNPTLAPDEPGGEAAIAGFARDWLEARGVEAALEEVAAGRPNVFAQVGRDGGRTLALCAHLDTVSAEGMTIPPFEPKVEDGRLYGRGAYDMKCGVAAVMAAAAALAADAGAGQALAGRVVLALVADEEYSSLGAADFVRRHPADGCIVTEPTEERIVLGHKGFVWARLRTEGVAAHGSRPDLGVSAVGKMGRIVAALEDLDHTTLRARTHPLVGPASMHAATIRGGSGLSTYAAACTLEVERRTLPGETASDVEAELREVVRRAGEEAEVEVFFARPPMTCDPDAPLARCLRHAASGVLGREAEEVGVGYWTDAAIFAEAGIPALLYGPGGAGAHAAVEWADVDSVVRCARTLVDAARRFTRPETPAA